MSINASKSALPSSYLGPESALKTASFSQLLASRELGILGNRLAAELEIKTRVVAEAMIKDHYHFAVITLPTTSNHIWARRGDYVAMIGNHRVDNTLRLSLWSLKNHCQLWAVDVDPELEELGNNLWYDNYYHWPKEHYLGEDGMVLLGSEKTKKVIVLNGLQTGSLPPYDWQSLSLIGNRILGCWKEHLSTGQQDWFGEWDETGHLLITYPLHSLSGNCLGRESCVYAYSEKAWVRLSSFFGDPTSIIEVIDRGSKIKKTFELSGKGMHFSCACIVQNHLIYGGYYDVFHPREQRSIACVYDWTKGETVKDLGSGHKGVGVEQMVANRHFIAWVEKNINLMSSNYHFLSYINRLSGQVENLRLNFSVWGEGMQTGLHIEGRSLSVSHLTVMRDRAPETSGSVIGACWNRLVVDMKTHGVKSYVQYKKPDGSQYSIANGTLLITEESRWYVESFNGERPSNHETSPFRIGETSDVDFT